MLPILKNDPTKKDRFMPGFIENRGAPDANNGEFPSNWSRQYKRILSGHNSFPSIEGDF